MLAFLGRMSLASPASANSGRVCADASLPIAVVKSRR
jgi:hypothetical protein